jgi:hypothetical protein
LPPAQISDAARSLDLAAHLAENDQLLRVDFRLHDRLRLR